MKKILCLLLAMLMLLVMGCSLNKGSTNQNNNVVVEETNAPGNDDGTEIPDGYGTCVCCNGSGNLGECLTCYGEGTITHYNGQTTPCMFCDAKGVYICNNCNGTGIAKIPTEDDFVAPSNNDDTTTPSSNDGDENNNNNNNNNNDDSNNSNSKVVDFTCRSCDGTGIRTCIICDGEGKITQTKYTVKPDGGESEYEIKYSCRGCNGKGKYNCIYCNGKGTLE